MRASSRTAILSAAVAVIESEGITAVTFDSVAAAADLTRGGVIYHFSSRDELISALHEHLAAEWDAQLVAACGRPAAEATAVERLIAYVRVAANAASRAELQMLVDSHSSDNFAPWGAVLARWTPQRDDPGGDGLEPGLARMALLAADGLWVNDAINERSLTQEERAQIAETIVRGLGSVARIDG